jgi:hypothetical protein
VLYFYQSGLLAIPGAFLAAWWLFIPLLGDRYLNWREPYAGLLFVVVVSEILVFILPMVSFHRLMLDRKNDLFGEADELSRRSVRPNDAGANENWAKRYAAIESMPTWPVDLRIRRRFGLRNALLLVPAVAQALGASQRTQDLIENLRTVLTG